MIKKTVKYTDFNDEEVEEDIYFHLTKPQLVEIEVSMPEGFEAWVEKVVEEENKAELFRIFVLFIEKGYGVRSADGKRFVKNERILEEFLSSNAYEALFMDVLSDTDKAIEFFNGIMPKGLVDEVAKVTPLMAVPQQEPETVTKSELIVMSASDLKTTLDRVGKGEVKIAE